ncbi:MAG: hypothetical protein K0Q51_69 [Rickettsiaceae bacterium]|jgi:hypothetical protein|nr:hypothetical protein [Rickettsiaceae bacterium]
MDDAVLIWCVSVFCMSLSYLFTSCVYRNLREKLNELEESITRHQDEKDSLIKSVVKNDKIDELAFKNHTFNERDKLIDHSYEGYNSFEQNVSGQVAEV